MRSMSEMEMQCTSVQRVLDMTAVHSEESMYPGEEFCAGKRQTFLRLLSVSACKRIFICFDDWSTRTHEICAGETAPHYTRKYQKRVASFSEFEPQSNWPNEGRIQFKNVSLRYDKNLDPVVTDVNIMIEPGQKVKLGSFRRCRWRQILSYASFPKRRKLKSCFPPKKK